MKLKLNRHFGVAVICFMGAISSLQADSTGNPEGSALAQLKMQFIWFKISKGEFPKGWDDPRWSETLEMNLSDYVERFLRVPIPDYYVFIDGFLETRPSEIQTTRGTGEGGRVMIMSKNPIRHDKLDELTRYVIWLDGNDEVACRHILESEAQSILSRADPPLPELATAAPRELLTASMLKKSNQTPKPSRGDDRTSPGALEKAGGLDGSNNAADHAEEISADQSFDLQLGVLLVALALGIVAFVLRRRNKGSS